MCTKKCGICGKDMPATSEFFASRKLKTKIVLQSNCMKCQKEYRREHYENNKSKYIKKAKAYNKSVEKWFEEIKKTLKCIKCGENRWWVLDFHHVNPEEKEYSLARLKTQGSKPKIINEMSKCTVLCSNCHRDLHYHEKINKD